jgi:SAM-dependent methyltransferase
MAFYQNRIVPLLINRAMRQRNFAVYRNRIIPAAEGRVLEIGIGSGLNLPFYSRNVAYVIGLEPSPKLLAIARRAQRTAGRLSNIYTAPKVRSHAFVPVARAQGSPGTSGCDAGAYKPGGIRVSILPGPAFSAGSSTPPLKSEYPLTACLP